MKVRFCALLLLLAFVSAQPATAQTRVIVRTTGIVSIQSLCAVAGCTVQYGLGDPKGLVFLVTTSLSPSLFLQNLHLSLGVADAELDLLGHAQQNSSGSAPSAIWDRTLINYHGVSVWHGYVYQPATQLVRLSDAQTAFNVTGGGIVAVIDTGVDPNHPVLVNNLLPGYDFTRNQAGGSEMADISQSSAAVLDSTPPATVSQSSAAVLDQSSAAVLDTSQYSAFGHGTMVSGIIHLVAPSAMILPMKAFRADGTGYTSDVIRAIYRSVQNGANVLSMSFNFGTSSQELGQAIIYANNKGVIAVAAAGNSGQAITVYPAGYSNQVIGVASTTNNDTLSSFSNYGQPLVWVGAPGEGIITTYPFGTYAATWGTSFSTPFVSGAAALLVGVRSSCNETQAAQAISHAQPISSAVGNGRLDLYQAVQAWRQALGIQ